MCLPWSFVLVLSPTQPQPCQLMSIACKLTAGPAGWSCGAARVKPKRLQVETPQSLPGAQGTSQTRWQGIATLALRNTFVKLLQFGLRKGAAESKIIKASQNASAPTNQQESGFLGMPAKRLPTLSDLNRKARRKRELLEKQEAQLQEQLQQEVAAKLQANARLRQQQ